MGQMNRGLKSNAMNQKHPSQTPANPGNPGQQQQSKGQSQPVGSKPAEVNQKSQSGQPSQVSYVGVQEYPVYSGELHFNEDPNSVPTPLSGGQPALTAT